MPKDPRGLPGRSPALACALTEPALRARKATLAATLSGRILRIKALKNGYAFDFDGSEETLGLLQGFILSERQCCPFFAFRLLVRPHRAGIRLSVSGPAGAKEFLADTLGMA